jgi:hypothetical protein
MNLQTRLDKLEGMIGVGSGGECECTRFENVRVILPDNGRGDVPSERCERCEACGRERPTIRVVYAESSSA